MELSGGFKAMLSPAKTESGRRVLVVVGLIPMQEGDICPVEGVEMLVGQVRVSALEAMRYSWPGGEAPSPEDWLENLGGCQDSKAWKVKGSEQ